MKYRPLGQSGIEASAVGLGAWAIGGWLWGGTDEAESIKAVHAAIDAGITLIDTAPIYGFGRSEEIVGKAIAGRRDRVVLATKCGLVWNSDKGEFGFHANEFGRSEPEVATHTVHRCIEPGSVREELEQSLTRLGVETIDLYQTHWQTSSTPVADTMGCLMKLKDEGKIRAIGVSNASAAQMAEYAATGPLDSDQERFSMLDRGIESDQLPYCREHGAAMLGYSPLGQGLLTGKVGPERVFPKGDLRLTKPRFSAESRERIAAMLAEFRPVADARGLTLAQLAIAWTIAQPGLTHALCGARNPQQALENAAAGDADLTGDDLAILDAAIARHAPGIE
jgi:methylglyoxal reductase